MLEDAERAIDTYRFDMYANTIYEFAWHEYCDWYLELTKPLLWDDDASEAELRGTRRALLDNAGDAASGQPTRSCRSSPSPSGGKWRRCSAIGGATIMQQPFP